MPTVTLVGGTETAYTSFGASLAASAPTGLASGDRLFAFVVSFSEITPPAGWTRIDACPAYTRTGVTGRIRAYQKDTVGSSDSGVSFTWSVSPSTSICVTYAAARSAGSQQVAHATVNSTATYTIAPASLSTSEDGELFLIVGSSLVQGSLSPAVVPSGFSKWTGATHEENDSLRLIGASKALDSGQSNTGNMVLDSGTPGVVNGLGSITLRLNGTAAPGANAIASSASPLGAALALSALEVSALSAAEGPLGLAAFAGYGRPVALASAPGPLSASAARAFHDFSGRLEEAGAVTYYVCDLVDGETVTRVPISSWQGTLQTAGSTYLQAVIPAAASVAEAVAALGETAEFVIYRGARLPDGATIEQEMSRSLVETARFDQGPQRYTCTISGYSDAIAPPLSAEPATDRTLRGVRSISSGEGGIRVRCAVDWFLRPGQVAIVGDVSFVAAYLNYYALARESYMDVGERTV